MKLSYVQYGCGLSAPSSWVNFDSSPTLRIQKAFLIGNILKSRLNTTFPPNVLYGDIIKGLPIADDSCDGVYCSHVLEHLSLNDFRKALTNTYKILKNGGIFRCIVPDLEYAARTYLQTLDSGDKQANLEFCGRNTLLGVENRMRGAKGLLVSYLGNAHHLWMWDAPSITVELEKAGFNKIRVCKFNDSQDQMFKEVEDGGRFLHAVAIECKK